MSPRAVEWYATPGPLTDLGERARALPAAVLDLCRVVQGLVVHPHMPRLYGLEPATLPLDDLELRPAAAKVERILARDPRPLTEARPPAKRLVGNCRDFSVLTCAALRGHGIPARARCGFADYFERGRFLDHWVCEVWAEDEWRLVDVQLDERQRDAFRIDFDPLDVPRTRFLVAGDAWARCRGGRADPELFGILDMHGLWFVRGNVVRDLAALTKRELLPWDGWGIMATHDLGGDDEMALLDRIATLTQTADVDRDEILRVQAQPGLRVPDTVVSFNLGGARVALPAGVAN